MRSWLCTWLLDCTDTARQVAERGAPEIDGGALGLALVLVVGVLLAMKGRTP